MAWSDAARAAAAEARRLRAKSGVAGYKTTIRAGHKILASHVSRLADRDLAYHRSLIKMTGGNPKASVKDALAAWNRAAKRSVSVVQSPVLTRLRKMGK